MNIDLLRRIQAHNAEHPEQLDMSEALNLSCGTIGCIAGHACFLSLAAPSADSEGLCEWKDVEIAALRLLKIGPLQGERLFHEAFWPLGWSELLRECWPGTPEYAEIANARIDHFIATGGAE